MPTSPDRPSAREASDAARRREARANASAAPAAPAAGRRLATVSNYHELIAGICQRLDELQLSQAALEKLSGLTNGYAGKLLGASRVKTLGMASLFLILETLAVRLTIEEDLDLLRKMESRYERRAELRAGRRSCAATFRPGEAGGCERAHARDRLPRRARSLECVAARMAQNAARSRWGRARNGR